MSHPNGVVPDPCPHCEALRPLVEEQQRRMDAWFEDLKGSFQALVASITKAVDPLLAAERAAAEREANPPKTYVGGDWHMEGCPMLLPPVDGVGRGCTCLDHAGVRFE